MNCSYLNTGQIFNSLRTGTVVPESTIKLSKCSRQFQTEDEKVQSQLLDIIVRLASINAAIRTETLSDPGSIKSELLSVEADLGLWVANLPPGLHYKTAFIEEDTVNCYAGYYHIYHGFRHATVWNHYRCARIFINNELLNHPCRCSSSISPATLKQISRCEQCQQPHMTLEITAQEICYSVPFILGNHDTWDHIGPTPRLSCIFGLMGPLHVAGTARGISCGLRKWIIRKFEEIGSAFGLRQATVFAEEIKSCMQ